jgi:branched-chain amino acid transport system substrate-binding protein
MIDHRQSEVQNSRVLSRAVARGAIALSCLVLAVPAAMAAGDNVGVVNDLAGRVGPILGAALACPDIAQSRIQSAADKFRAVIRNVQGSDADRDTISQSFDRSVAEGRSAVTFGRADCKVVDRQLADLERSVSSSLLAAVVSPVVAPAAAATAPTAMLPSAPVHGITDREIRFGIVMPFSGSVRETARLFKVGVDIAFSKTNEAGGVNGRMLKLIAADDNYDPTKTVEAMKGLYEKDQVFGYIGNFGTPTAVTGIPYALERRALFFAPFTGAGVVRHDPPDRYVFNYRASYTEETDALVKYLVKIRRLQPRQIAVFAQNDSFGDSGYQGVAKAYRTLGFNDATIIRVNYPRNTVDVDEAINQLKLLKVPVRAVIMVATTRAAAKFIEKSHDALPGLIYANISVVGSTFASELLLLGPRFTNGVIVTQAVPAVSGYSSTVLEYKTALTKYAAGEAADYLSLEGYIAATVLIEAMKRVGPALDTEKLVDSLEGMRNFDLGLGAMLNYGRAEHQASHKVWGTALDETGVYQAIDLE